MTEKVKWELLYETYAFPKNLSFLTCQIWSFKPGETSLRKNLIDNSLTNIPAAKKKESVIHNKTKLTQWKYVVTILKYLIGVNYVG